LKEYDACARRACARSMRACVSERESHNELPRLRRLLNASCPGVSMMRRPGTLTSIMPYLLQRVNIE